MGSPDPVTDRDRSAVSLTLVAMVLALVAGFVDAVGYLHVINVFPANQSGNVAFLGLSIGGASPAPGWGPPVAIAAFMVGAAVGRWSSLRVGPRRGAATLLGVELVLLTAVAVIFARGGRARAVHNDRRAGRRARHRGTRDGRADRRHPLRSPVWRCRPLTCRGPSPASGRPSAHRREPRAQVRATAVGRLVAGAGCVRGRSRARREPTRRRPHWLPRTGGAGRGTVHSRRARDPGRARPRHPRWGPGAERRALPS